MGPKQTLALLNRVPLVSVRMKFAGCLLSGKLQLGVLSKTDPPDYNAPRVGLNSANRTAQYQLHEGLSPHAFSHPDYEVIHQSAFGQRATSIAQGQ